MIRPDISGSFGTVLTVGAGIVAINMVRHMERPPRTYKSKPKPPAFGGKNYPYKPYSIKPMNWKL